jgi:hypothetical protein
MKIAMVLLWVVPNSLISAFQHTARYFGNLGKKKKKILLTPSSGSNEDQFLL